MKKNKLILMRALFSTLYLVIGVYSFYLNYKFGHLWAGGVLEGILFAFILFVGMAGATFASFNTHFSKLSRVLTGLLAILLVSISIWTTFLLKAHESYALYSEKNMKIEGVQSSADTQQFSVNTIKSQIESKMNIIKNKQNSIETLQKEEEMRLAQYKKESAKFQETDTMEIPAYKSKHTWTIRQLNKEIDDLNKEISALQEKLSPKKESQEMLKQDDFHIVNTFKQQFNFLSVDNLMNIMNFIFSALGDVLNIFLIFLIERLNSIVPAETLAQKEMRKKYDRKRKTKIELESKILKKLPFGRKVKPVITKPEEVVKPLDTKLSKNLDRTVRINSLSQASDYKLNPLKLKKFIYKSGCLTVEEFYQVNKESGLAVSAPTMNDLINGKRTLQSGLQAKTVVKLIELNKVCKDKFNFQFLERK